MLVAADAFFVETGFRLPYGVLQIVAADVTLVVGIGIAETSIDAVGVVLLFLDVPVHAQAEVGSCGLIGQSCHLVGLVVGMTYSHLEDGEPLVVQIDAQSTLILTIVAEHQLGRPHEVERQGKATEECYRIFLHPEQLLALCLQCY